MDNHHFDTWTRSLANRLPRRRLWQNLASVALAVTLIRFGRAPVAAQEAAAKRCQKDGNECKRGNQCCSGLCKKGSAAAPPARAPARSTGTSAGTATSSAAPTATLTARASAARTAPPSAVPMPAATATPARGTRSASRSSARGSSAFRRPPGAAARSRAPAACGAARTRTRAARSRQPIDRRNSRER